MKLYTLPGCPVCEMVKENLDKRKATYSVSQDTTEMIGLGISHVPVLMLDTGEKLSGVELINYSTKGE